MERGCLLRCALLAGVVFACLAPVAVLAGPTNAAPALPPSPVQVFRKLLVMTPQEREDYLTMHPPGMREPVEAKVKEYLALSPEERELRLQATELRFYFMHLMPQPASNRPALLAQVPEPMRAVVQARLDLWGLLPPPMQSELLENEQAVRYFTRPGVVSAAQRRALLDGLPPEERAKVEADIARFQALPEETRRRMFQQFSQLFDLTPDERAKSLRHLSEAEREAMEQTLNAFGELTAEQRQVCLRSFEKFAGMSLAERQRFLRNAQAWQRMTPTERERWRELVARVPDLPPLPPGMVLPPPVPASPPGKAPQR
jgi:hypothetical protein